MRLFQRKNGIWYIEFERGKKKTLKTKDKAFAQKLFKQIEKEILLGKILKLDNQRLNLQDFINEYLDHREKTKAENTVRNDKYALKKLLDYIGNVSIPSITKKQADDFIGWLKVKKYEPAAINIDIRHLKAAFNKAIEWEYIKESPFKYVKQLEIKDSLPNALTLDEVKRLLEAIEDIEFKEYIYTCLYTGGRRTEVLKAQWQDFKLMDDTWYLKLKVTKRRTKIIPVAEKLQELLFYRKKNIGPVFPALYLKHPSKASTKFADYAKKAGIKHELHDLRHTCATFLVLSKVPMRMIQQILGHSSIKTTEIYTKLVAEQLKGIMNVLSF
jgi:integrase